MASRKTTLDLQNEALAKFGKPNLFKIVAKGELICEAQEGMQEKLFFLSEFLPPDKQANEILLGGRRGPGKTFGLLMWMAVPTWHKNYMGLLARFSGEALKETIEEASALYSKMGAKVKDRPVQFHFPSGAVIYTSHFKDQRSLEDLRGHQYQRIGIEEACQIEKFEMYAGIQGANRSVLDGVPAKICLTANPDGPGNGWVKRHFINVMAGGVKVEPGKTFRDPVTKRIRVFIPGGLADNQILLKRDPGYYDRLRLNAPHIVRAWIHGDWDAGSSQFLEEWRPDGPLNRDEPAWARHTVDSRPIYPWLHRWSAIDWGYAHHSAAYWGAYAEDKRIHVYREMVARKLEPDVLGAEWAKLTAPDLEGLTGKHMTLYFSHEAFRNKTTSEKTIADLFMVGVERILGPNSAFVLRENDRERELKKTNPQAAMEMMIARRSAKGSALKVTIRENNPDRVAGAGYVRSLLRWKPLDTVAEPDMQYASELLSQNYEAYEKYMKMYEKVKPEVLPGVQIHKCCKVLIDTIPRLQPDPDRLEDNLKFHGGSDDIGDDPWEAFRSLCMGYKEFENKMPTNIWLAEEVKKYVPETCTDINLRIQVMRSAIDRHSKTELKEHEEVFLDYDCLLGGF